MAEGTVERRRTRQQLLTIKHDQLQLLTIQHDKVQLQHSDTSSQMQEAMAQMTGLARDQLVEQYHSYSWDLAHQAKRLGEQLAMYQSAKLVTREAGLVQHVTSLKTQLQGVVTQVLQGRECYQYAGDTGLEDQRVQVDRIVGPGPAGGGLPE